MTAPIKDDATGMLVADISSEAWREYDHLESFMSSEGTVTYGVITTRIAQPLKLWIKPKDGRTGSHRVKDALGTVHYIPEDWKRLRWAKKSGDSNDVDF